MTHEEMRQIQANSIGAAIAIVCVFAIISICIVLVGG